MYKHILALAALVAASGYFMQSVAPANAQTFGPTVTGGEIPWVSWAGTASGSGYTIVYTVPSDKVLVITGASTQNTYLDVYEDSTLKVKGYSRAMTEGALNNGSGHIVIGSGSTLRVRPASSTTCYYTIQGYLAHP